MELAAGGAAAAAALVAITIYIFFGTSSQPFSVDTELPAGPWTFARLRDAAADAVLASRRHPGFSGVELCMGRLFVKPEPPGLPTRPTQDELPLKRSSPAVTLASDKCILLDLGDVVPAGAGASAAGGGGGGVASPAPGEKRLRFLEEEVHALKESKLKLEEEVHAMKKARTASKAFSKVGSDEIDEIFRMKKIGEGPRLGLPESVVHYATTIALEPDLPYAWKDDETEPAATPRLLSILAARIGHAVVDARSVKLPPVEAGECEYNGFTDGAVLPLGYEGGTTMKLAKAAAFLEFKDPTAFASPPQHEPQSLLEMLVTKRPVFTTDMVSGFKVWVLRGTVFHAYHGDKLLSLREGIALLWYYARQADAEVEAWLATAAPGGAAGPSSSGEGAPEGQPPEGPGGPPGSAAASGVPPGLGGGKAAGGGRKASAETLSDDEEGPPADYEEYKLRALWYAQVLRTEGIAVPDSVLAGLG